MNSKSGRGEDNDRNNITIGLVGDVMIGRLVNQLMSGLPADKSSTLIWGDVLPLLQSNNLNVINLEAALTHSNKTVTKVFNFKARPEHVQALIAANVSCANIANNHILDFDVEGLMETVETLERANIPYVGAGKNAKESARPIILSVGGVRIGIIGCTDNEPGWEAGANAPGIRYVVIEDPEDPRCLSLFSDIAALREQVDLLILSIHWGPNMRELPTRSFRAFAHLAIDHGTDILHGHSAHIFQGVEVYRQKLILYDTGDFIDDYYVDPELRNDRSFLFLVELKKGSTDKGQIHKLRLIPVTISDCQVNLAIGQEATSAISRMKTLSQELGTSLTIENQNLVLYQF